MNCFVIMPFAQEFDDVYVAIKTAVEAAMPSDSGRCFRLDESRPAGRITDRLRQEIEASSFCIADITGLRHNVMWELGYAMALGRPAIVVTQSTEPLPFDIHDLQSLSYDRNRLNRSLKQPLQRMVGDTLRDLKPAAGLKDDPRELTGDLLQEVAELRKMVAQAVELWSPRTGDPRPVHEVTNQFASLEGCWTNDDGTSMYARVIKGELVVPYCYCGNDSLTAVYYGWKRVGEYWFARYAWFGSGARPRGFAFLRQVSADELVGAWWYEYAAGSTDPQAPPGDAGVHSRLRRSRGAPVPAWAAEFFERVERLGVAAHLGR